MPDKPTALIVTALPVEFKAARAYLTDVHEDTHPSGTVYDVGIFEGWRVALTEMGKGNPTAAAGTERAIARFKPTVALFVGVAGGLKDVKCGDVVAVTKVYGYESGKVTEEGFLPRAEGGLTDFALEQRARAEARSSTWVKERLKTRAKPAPQVFVGPIVAGEKLVADSASSTAELFRRIFSDALAVEMEAIGFLAAVRASSPVQAMVIRGISDLLDNKSDIDDTKRQEKAAKHAAAFAFQILAKVKTILRDNSEAANSFVSHRPIDTINTAEVVIYDPKGKKHDISILLDLNPADYEQRILDAKHWKVIHKISEQIYASSIELRDLIYQFKFGKCSLETVNQLLAQHYHFYSSSHLTILKSLPATVQETGPVDLLLKTEICYQALIRCFTSSDKNDIDRAVDLCQYMPRWFHGVLIAADAVLEAYFNKRKNRKKIKETSHESASRY